MVAMNYRVVFPLLLLFIAACSPDITSPKSVTGAFASCPDPGVFHQVCHEVSVSEDAQTANANAKSQCETCYAAISANKQADINSDRAACTAADCVFKENGYDSPCKLVQCTYYDDPDGDGQGSIRICTQLNPDGTLNTDDCWEWEGDDYPVPPDYAGKWVCVYSASAYSNPSCTPKPGSGGF